VATGTLRLVVALTGGWLALHATGSLSAFFAALAAASLIYGVVLFGAVRGGTWSR
jgi:MATE family, multidrug efflux pump